jgi:hypothetical protein
MLVEKLENEILEMFVVFMDNIKYHIENK